MWVQAGQELDHCLIAPMVRRDWGGAGGVTGT